MHLPSQLVFLAKRNDGFGSRIDALVHAMALAELYGGSWRMRWTEAEVEGWHSMEDASAVFEPDFIAANTFDPATIGRVLSFRTFIDLPDRDAAIREAGTLHVEAPWVFPDDWLAGQDPDAFRALAMRCFAAIGFNARLTRVLAEADRVALPEGVAGLHLRAGDVVYGRERLSLNHYRKATPYQLASHYLAERAARGLSTLIFGQDEALCRALAGAHGAIFAGDVMPAGLSPASEAELFDIALISRCTEVIGGTSAFLLAGSLRGGSTLRQMTDLFDDAAAARIILDETVPVSVEAAASGAQKALSIWTVVRERMADRAAGADEILTLLEAAGTHDPDNAFLDLARASVMVKAGRLAEAEALVKARARDGSGTLLHNLTHRLKTSGDIPKNSPISQACKVLLGRKTSDLPWCQSAALIHFGAQDEAGVSLGRSILAAHPGWPADWTAALAAAIGGPAAGNSRPAGTAGERPARARSGQQKRKPSLISRIGRLFSRS